MNPLIFLPIAVAGYFLLSGKSASASSSKPPPLAPPRMPGAKKVIMKPGTVWKVVGYNDPGHPLNSAALGAWMESQGHKLVKFVATDKSGWGYTVKVGPSGMELYVPNYDPPIHVTTAQQVT